jgi:hypothetical protein
MIGAETRGWQSPVFSSLFPAPAPFDPQPPARPTLPPLPLKLSALPPPGLALLPTMPFPTHDGEY